MPVLNHPIAAAENGGICMWGNIAGRRGRIYFFLEKSISLKFGALAMAVQAGFVSDFFTGEG